MGYTKHHAILVTHWDEKRLTAAYMKAKELFPAVMITAISYGPLNGYGTFAIIPDGSKEGWPESEHFDTLRAQFIDWLETQRWEDGSSRLNWVELSYDEDGECEIGRHMEPKGEAAAIRGK